MQLRQLAILPCLTMPLVAEVLNPVSYALPNGELGAAGQLYRDDLYSGRGDRNRDREPLSEGLGQLTDGLTGCGDDPRADCGRGAGFDWVGWREDATLIFTFGPRHNFRVIRIFTANSKTENAPLWKSATVSFSEDGLNFKDFVVRTTTEEERGSPNAQQLEIPVNGAGRFIRIRLNRGDPQSWLLISDVAFEGSIATHQISPETP